ncbi:MAG: tetratricopeptide repeat protein [Myxococcales bacterium]|nr:tetratricopeptide repeat protein [Myxococcales bacterium]
MRSLPSRPRLALTLALRRAAVARPLGSAIAMMIASASPAAVAAPSDADEAKAAIARAREATRAGDYQAALEHFEHALRLQPAAKLYFNIAVCHHRLLATETPGSPPYERHRAAAVESYNRYLQAAPDAKDADAVAEVVRALGGTPLSADDPEPWSIELIEPDELPDAPGFDDEWSEDDGPPPSDSQTDSRPQPDGSPPPTKPTPPTRPHGPVGRIGAYFPVLLGSPAQLAEGDEPDLLPMIGLGLRGNAFLGPKRALALGGELSLTSQPIDGESRHRLTGAILAILVESRHPVGRRGRIELGGGGSLGLVSQGLVYTGDAPLRCSPGREASRRGGLVGNARLTVMALLGERRNHELSLRVGPGLALLAKGSKPEMDADGNSCADEPTAFETFGLRDGPALVVSIDLGYAPRF